MTANDAQQVRSCGEVTVGDEIEAWHNGRLFHRGEVLRTVPATDLFWIRDRRTETRRLIDAEALVILRVAKPAFTDAVAVEGSATATATATAASGRTVGMPAADRAAARVPASHIPLFQAPAPVS